MDELKQIALRYILNEEYKPRNGEIHLNEFDRPTGYALYCGLYADDVSILANAYIEEHWPELME